MDRHQRILNWCIGLMVCLCLANTSEAAKPNVILIFCDDLGYGDIACFGSKKHRTPHIDSLARDGIRLTSFYSTSGVCTPSRSSLMTGCYPRRTNMHEDARRGWVLFPVAHKGLNPDEITVAEQLKAQGYVTGIVGKWHLGDQLPFLPTRQGFDSYFGIPYSNDMGVGNQGKNYPPLPLMRNEEVIEKEPDQALITKRYTHEALDFIRAHHEKPFFLYMPHTMPHDPLFASEQFKGKSDNGIYGDAIEEIDWSVGEILDELDALEIAENTLVIFTSDNGASPRYGGSNLPLSGFKGSTLEGGMRVPFAARWPAGIKPGSVSDEITSTIDIMPTLTDLTGGELPRDRTIDGKSIAAILSGKLNARSPHEAFYYYFRDELQAVRVGDFKLHLARVNRRTPKLTKIPSRLINLAEDIAERHDVSVQYPEVLRELMQYADAAKLDLGHLAMPGTDQRPAGRVGTPEPLTQHD